MTGPSQSPEGALEAAISAAIARLYLEKWGKGPMYVRTFVNDDTVTTVMRDVFTAAEHSLIAAGRSESVLATRMLWQEATDTAFKTSLQEVCERSVLTVISGFSLADDRATEVFLLAPRPDTFSRDGIQQ